jgi:hypothetical protein
MIEKLIRNAFSHRLHGMKLFWRPAIRVFCDGGYPVFRWLPHFRRLHYAPYWGMCGFAVYLFGREINFSFGMDRNGLYAK